MCSNKKSYIDFLISKDLFFRPESGLKTTKLRKNKNYRNKTLQLVNISFRPESEKQHFHLHP